MPYLPLRGGERAGLEVLRTGTGGAVRVVAALMPVPNRQVWTAESVYLRCHDVRGGTA